MPLDTAALHRRFTDIRAFSERLCEPLRPEDYVAQSMPEASPTKWHLAHTTWFFDRFILQDLCGRAPARRHYDYLVNSYYNGAGEQYPRARRGMITRPGVDEVFEYRCHVDAAIRELISAGNMSDVFQHRLEVGLHHEQQHQELMLTDLKHLMWQNPLRPAFFAFDEQDAEEPVVEECRPTSEAVLRDEFDGGIYEVGHRGPAFSYDNERPRHQVLLQPFELARRPVTCAEYLEFIEDGGYRTPQWWLSEGWDKLQAEGWKSPLYWEKHDGRWHQFTLGGFRPVEPTEPVVHVSYYEAQAYAAWAGARLPGEAEWEVVAQRVAQQDAQRDARDGNFVESGRFHPRPVPPDPPGPVRLFGDIWEWTAGSYGPYPGFKPFEGALGEYNGKFMCGQYVLRGGSCATPESHIRATYRNFFHPGARWQFSGIRLAW
jgi:ergothioneine biosynthesis protein EgtB